MIIRSLSIQSHDDLGAAVRKLMIISVCCIQTQLIVFMPNAGLCTHSLIYRCSISITPRVRYTVAFGVLGSTGWLLRTGYCCVHAATVLYFGIGSGLTGQRTR